MGDSSAFLNVPHSSAKANFPPAPLPLSWTASWGATKKSGLWTFCWLRFERDHLAANAYPRLFQRWRFYLYFSVFFPLLRVWHRLRKSWLRFHSPGCCSEACCKTSLAHGGRKTQKHMMYLEKLKIIFQCSDGKLLKWEELLQLQGKPGLK